MKVWGLRLRSRSSGFALGLSGFLDSQTHSGTSSKAHVPIVDRAMLTNEYTDIHTDRQQGQAGGTRQADRQLTEAIRMILIVRTPLDVPFLSQLGRNQRQHVYVLYETPRHATTLEKLSSSTQQKPG